jgi:hypothetical protein
MRLRSLQSPAEIGVDKSTTVVFRAPLMTTIAGLGSFLAREAAATGPPSAPAATAPIPVGTVNGASESSEERGDAWAS